jgi:hypothetical protein
MLKEDFIVILPLPHNYKSLIVGIGCSLKFPVRVDCERTTRQKPKIEAADRRSVVRSQSTLQRQQKKQIRPMLV